MANPFPFSSGDVLTAADLNDIGEWTSFTPSWSNLTVGNGTQTAVYAQVNEVVVVSFSLTLGSTSSIGSGPRFSLPVTGASYSDYHSLGVLACVDGTTIAFGHVSYTGGNAYPRIGNSSGTYLLSSQLTASVPFTWGTNDRLMGTFTYRAA